MVQTLLFWIAAAASVRVWVRRMKDARQQRRKPPALDRLAGGQGDGPKRAPVKGVEEGKDVWTPCRVARQLDRALDGLRARIAEVYLLGLTTGSQFGQPLGHPDIGRIEEVRKGKMDEPIDLGRNRADHLFVTVSDGADRDARGEVQVAVPVHIPDVASGGVVHDERIGLRGRRSDVPFIPAQEHPGAGSGGSRANMQGRHGAPHIGPTFALTYYSVLRGQRRSQGERKIRIISSDQNRMRTFTGSFSVLEPVEVPQCTQRYS